MLTSRKLRLGAVLVHEDDWDRTVDLGLRAGNPDLDVPVQRWYGAGRFAQPPEPGCDSYAVISRLGRCDAEDVPD
jgi:hypothetical protein